MGKFVVSATKNGGVKFNLKATNGEIIAVSEVYNTKASCLKGVNSVKTNACAHVENQTVEGYATEKCPKYEVYQDKAGEYRFRLKAKNGQIVAVSEGYKSLKTCLNGIESVGKNAPEAAVVEE